MLFPQINGYLIERELGKGKNGTVYLAQSLKEGKTKYAIKTIDCKELGKLTVYPAINILLEFKKQIDMYIVLQDTI